MANPFYTASGAPVAQSRGSSGSERAEFLNVQAGFDKFPPSVQSFYTNNATFGTDTGAANAFAVAGNVLVTALADGMEIVFKAVNANTGAATVNFNALGIKPITRPDGSPLQSGDIAVGQIVELRYVVSTGSYQFLNLSSSAVATASASSATASASSATASANSATASANSATASANSAAAAASSALTGTFKNRIINGDMRIDQRNSGAAITLGNANFYAVDRFYAVNGLAGGTITAQQSTLNGAKSLLITATAAVTDLSASKFVDPCRQIIEGQNCFDLNGKAVSLSFKVQTNWTGKLPVTFNNAAFTRSYIIDVPVTSGINIVVIPAVILEAASVATNDSAGGLVITIGFCNSVALQTTTTNAWVAGAFFCTAQSTQWVVTNGNYINITEVQLEPGTVATPFERRPIGVELTLCQRYYQWLTSYVGRWQSQATIFNCAGNYSTPMRSVPTVSLVGSPTVTEFGVAGRSITNITASSLGTTSGRFDLTTATATAGNSGSVESQSFSASAFISLTAEL